MVQLRRRNSQTDLESSREAVLEATNGIRWPTTNPTPNLKAKSSEEDLQSSKSPVSTILIMFRLHSRRIVLLFTLILVSSIVGYIYLDSQTFTIPFFPIQLTDPSIEHEAAKPSFTGFTPILSPEDHNTRAPRVFHYNWTVTSDTRRPDGILKRIYLINDQFPGPTLEGRPGDKFIIRVESNLADEGLSMHWHGLYMRGQNEHDGATGITQCPIPAGKAYTYEITIADNQDGTFWYHAHEQVQRADGVYGAFIIHKPIQDGMKSDLIKHGYDKEIVLLISDWYHRTAKEAMAWYMSAVSFGNEPVPDSIVINGWGQYNCSLAVPARPVDCVRSPIDRLPGVTLDLKLRYRVRLVNTGSLAGFALRFNGFVLKPITVDGGHTVGSTSGREIGNLHPGERVDIIMTSESQNSHPDVRMEITLDDDSFQYNNPALARSQSYIIKSKSSGYKPSSSKITTPSTQDKVDIQKLVSTETLPKNFNNYNKPNNTMVLYTTTMKLASLSNKPHGFMNQTTWKPQSNPNLPLLSLPRSKWDKHQFVPFINSTTSRWITFVINNLDDGGHPFHLHGYDFYVLSTYGAPLDERMEWGSYNPFDPSKPAPGGKFNVENPVRRDTVFIPKRGYGVIRFLPDNPGIWMLHCHLLWHQASGMAMAIHVGEDEKVSCDGVRCEEKVVWAGQLCSVEGGG
ncbi:Laccase-2 [Arthrobotrys entomopaga]|nr:Laccase-2 [Arthrobotrys entomopaga]